MSVTLEADETQIPGLDENGKPDPAYAEHLGLRAGSAGRRAAAFSLDAVIWAVLAAPAVFGYLAIVNAILAGNGDLSTVSFATFNLPLISIIVGQSLTAVFGLVQLILHGRRGITVGKASFGLRSVNVRTFGPVGFWRIVLRTLVLLGSQLLVPVIGPLLFFVSFAWDPNKRGRSWLDRVAGCFVVDTRRGLDPFNVKAMRNARRAAAANPAEAAAPLPSLASDRSSSEEFFVPLNRSSSGVVAVGAGLDNFEDWTMTPQDAEGADDAEAELVLPTPAPPTPFISEAPLTQSRVVPAGPEYADAQNAEPTGYVLHLDDGTSLAAWPYGRIGRAPTAAPTPERGQTQLLPLTDPKKLISKTHAEFGVSDSGFWVADCGSTNGTEIELTDGRTAPVLPGTVTPVPLGSRVIVGGRSFTVSTARGEMPR